MEIAHFGIQSSTYHTRPGQESQDARWGRKMGKALGNGRRPGCKRDNPKRAAGNGPGDGNAGQSADKRGGGRKKSRDGEIPSRLFVLLFPCSPLDALTGGMEQECAFLNKPASRPDSSGADPWGSPPASRKNSHFCGAPYCITGARSESGPRQGSHGGPLDALTGDVEQEYAVS